MIPNQTRENTVTTVGTGRTQKAFIGKDAVAHVMKLLTDLYSDQMLAVIREYSTNALDSHKAVGNTEPIQITLPTQFDRSFTIEDFGMGLAISDVYNTYLGYGISTKTDSNLFNGMMGLGCKSALTFTDQFTVTATKDGVRFAGTFHKDANGEATMTELSTVADRRYTADDMGLTQITTDTEVKLVKVLDTDFRDGVKVEIPLPVGHHVVDFLTKARKFYRFWGDDMPIFTNDECFMDEHTLPEPAYSNGTVEIYDNMYDDVVVMGNVPYPLDVSKLDNIKNYRNGTRMVIWADMGEVAFTPAREALMYNKLTMDFLNKAVAELVKNIEDDLTAELATATTYAEAHSMYHDHGMKRLLNDYSGGTGTPEFDGVSLYYGISTTKRTIYYALDNANSVGNSKGSTHNLSSFKDAVFLISPDRDDMTTTNRRKWNMWLEDKGLSYNRVYVVNAAKIEDFFTKDADVICKGLPTFTLADIEGYKPTRTTSGGGTTTRPPGKFRFMTSSNYRNPRLQDVDLTPDVIVYAAPSELGTEKYEIGKYIASEVPFYVVNMSRTEEFKELAGKRAVHIHDYIVKLLKDKFNALTPLQKGEFATTFDNVSLDAYELYISNETLDLVKDTRFKTYQNLITDKGNRSDLDFVKKLRYLASRLGVKVDDFHSSHMKTVHNVNKLYKELREEYPLATHGNLRSVTAEHVAFYINSVYDAKETEKTNELQ